MNKITLYHNSRCSKSRAVFEILENSKVEFRVVEYLTTPPSTQVLDALLIQLNKGPEQIVRTGEDEYVELRLSENPPQSRVAWLEVLVKHPILIERPIVSDGRSAVIGRPPELVEEWLKGKK